MKTTFLKGVALGSAVSLATLAATAAFAGTGVGSVFNLGQTNRANARSQLEGSTPSAVLNVTNSDKAASASGLSIDVPGNNPPMVVNSATKVKNLNADLLDGQHSSSFEPTISQGCTLGAAVASIDPSGTATCTKSSLQAIDLHEPPNTGSTTTSYTPSSIQLSLQCASFADVTITSKAAATLSYSYDEVNTAPTVGNQTMTVDSQFFANASPQLVGQFIYVDQTSITTITLSANNENADGCEFHGTVEVVPS